MQLASYNKETVNCLESYNVLFVYKFVLTIVKRLSILRVIFLVIYEIRNIFGIFCSINKTVFIDLLDHLSNNEYISIIKFKILDY